MADSTIYDLLDRGIPQLTDELELQITNNGDSVKTTIGAFISILPQGPAGPEGPRGLQGEPGAPGQTGPQGPLAPPTQKITPAPQSVLPNTAPIRLTDSSLLMSVPETGAIEYANDVLYFTTSAGRFPVQLQINASNPSYQSISLTSFITSPIVKTAELTYTGLTAGKKWSQVANDNTLSIMTSDESVFRLSYAGKLSVGKKVNGFYSYIGAGADNSIEITSDAPMTSLSLSSNNGTSVKHVLANGSMTHTVTTQGSIVDMTNIQGHTMRQAGDSLISFSAADVILNDSRSSRDVLVRTQSDASAIVVKPSGLVGVGVSSPAAKLHVKSANTQVRLAYNDSVYADMTVDSSGMLTAAADEITLSSGVVSVASNTSSRFTLSGADDGVRYASIGIGSSGDQWSINYMSNSDLDFAKNASTSPIFGLTSSLIKLHSMRLDSSGELTSTNTDNTLRVASAGTPTLSVVKTTANGSQSLSVSIDDNDYATITANKTGSSNTPKVKFVRDATTAMMIDDSGVLIDTNMTLGTLLFVNQTADKIGVGTNNPQEQLHVAGNLQVDGAIYSDSLLITIDSLPVIPFSYITSTPTTISGYGITDAYTKTETDTALSSKLPASSYSAADVLSKLKTVDGVGSGLDADTLAGYNASAFMLAGGTSFSSLSVSGVADLAGGAKIKSRVYTTTTAPTLSVNTDNYDAVYISALATDIMLLTPAGTPRDGQKLTITIRDNGVEHNILHLAGYTTNNAITKTKKYHTTRFSYEFRALSNTWMLINQSQVKEYIPTDSTAPNLIERTFACSSAVGSQVSTTPATDKVDYLADTSAARKCYIATDRFAAKCIENRIGAAGDVVYSSWGVKTGTANTSDPVEGDECRLRVWLKFSSNWSWNPVASGQPKLIDWYPSSKVESQIYITQAELNSGSGDWGAVKIVASNYTGGGWSLYSGTSADCSGVGAMFPIGEWFSLELYVKISSDPNKARIKCWLNDNLILERGGNDYGYTGRQTLNTTASTASVLGSPGIVTFRWWDGTGAGPDLPNGSQSMFCDSVIMEKGNTLRDVYGRVDVYKNKVLGSTLAQQVNDADISKLTSATQIPFELGKNYYVTLSHNAELIPQNVKSGLSSTIYVRQDTTGSRALDFKSPKYKKIGTGPEIGQNPGDYDIIVCNASTDDTVEVLDTLSFKSWSLADTTTTSSGKYVMTRGFTSIVSSIGDKPSGTGDKIDFKHNRNLLRFTQGKGFGTVALSHNLAAPFADVQPLGCYSGFASTTGNDPVEGGETWCQFRMKLSDNWSWADGTSTISLGACLAEIRPFSTAEGRVNIRSAYYNGNPGYFYIETKQFTGGDWSIATNADGLIPIGEWVTVELYIKHSATPASATIKLYVNGVEIMSSTGSGSLQTLDRTGSTATTGPSLKVMTEWLGVSPYAGPSVPNGPQSLALENVIMTDDPSWVSANGVSSSQIGVK